MKESLTLPGIQSAVNGKVMPLFVAILVQVVGTSLYGPSSMQCCIRWPVVRTVGQMRLSEMFPVADDVLPRRHSPLVDCGIRGH